MVERSPHGLQRRVAGYHDIRLDGIGDILFRARGASVLDIGCNRGLVGFEFANNGARLVHGCDNFEDGVRTARELFADLRAVESRFEVVDLTIGAEAMAPFGKQQYDMVLLLATYHKLRRIMDAELLAGLVRDLGNRTIRYFAWRSTARDHENNIEERKRLDKTLNSVGLTCVQLSHISDLGPGAIWERK